MTMKKITAFLLAMLLVVSFAACGNTEDPTEPATEPPTEAPTEPVDMVNSLSLVLQESADSFKSLNIMDNGDGTVYVEMHSEIIKKGNLDASVMQSVSEAFENSGLKALNEQNVASDNQDIMCSMFVECSENFIMADIYGEVPEAFATGYAAMESCIAGLMADIPEYVPAPQVTGNIADSDKTALDAILAGLTLEAPDAFAINGISVDDEAFAYSTGLPSAEGIASAVSFSPMMTTSAYSLVIVTLAEGTDADAVAKSFEDNIDWLKWICVQPDGAAVAVKDNQVLCLLGSGELYTQTITAIEGANWIPYSSLENPNLEG